MQIGRRTRREREKPRRIAFQPQNESVRREQARRGRQGRKPHKEQSKRVIIDSRALAIEMGLDHYVTSGRVIQLYCPDCGDFLNYTQIANFSRQCMNDDCHFIGYKQGVPVREALSIDDHKRARRDRISRLGKARWNRPGYREKVAEKMKKRWEDPEYREEQTERMKTQCNTPEYLEALSERMIEHWKDPEFREKAIMGHRIAIQARKNAVV